MKKAAKVKVDRMVLAYSYLQASSWNALEQAKEAETGRFYNCMTAMLHSAFCLEAYLNHLGAKKVTCWNVLERKLSPGDKLEVLAKTMNFSIDVSQRPFQTFKQIFGFRNALVHARTEYVSVESEQRLGEGERPSKPQADWEKMISLRIAQRFFDDTRAMIVMLHAQAGYKQDPFWTLETSHWEIKRSQ